MNLETLTIKLKADLSGLKSGMNQAKAETSNLTKSVEKSTSGLTKSFNKMGKGLLGEFKKTFKQLAGVIALTATIKNIYSAISATENWDKKIQGVKNQWQEMISRLSQLTQPLLEKLLPIVEKVISYINKGITAIGALFGIKITAGAIKANKAINEVKRSLASFDDLNILSNTPTSEISVSDISDVIEEIDEKVAKIKLSDIGDKIKTSVKNVNWEGVGATIADIITVTLDSVLTLIGLKDKINSKLEELSEDATLLQKCQAVGKAMREWIIKGFGDIGDIVNKALYGAVDKFAENYNLGFLKKWNDKAYNRYQNAQTTPVEYQESPVYTNPASLGTALGANTMFFDKLDEMFGGHIRNIMESIEENRTVVNIGDDQIANSGSRYNKKYSTIIGNNEYQMIGAS